MTEQELNDLKKENGWWTKRELIEEPRIWAPLGTTEVEQAMRRQYQRGLGELTPRQTEEAA